LTVAFGAAGATSAPAGAARASTTALNRAIVATCGGGARLWRRSRRFLPRAFLAVFLFSARVVRRQLLAAASPRYVCYILSELVTALDLSRCRTAAAILLTRDAYQSFG
jgi:hypothetical protein